MDLPGATPIGSFDHQPRTRIVFGNGSLARLGELARELGALRVLLVTDKGIVAAGHAARAEAFLIKAGCEVARFDEVRENPTTLDVSRCLDVARGFGVDLFVGLGGGSSMDTAKGCNLILTNGGEIRDYWGVGKASRPMLPLIAVPTTAGTGSECQSAALIADEGSHQKMACLDPKAAARIAILDPELTVSQPTRVTSVTGVDAIAHALESAVTTRRSALSWTYSQHAFVLCAGSLPIVLASPQNLEWRGRMLLGAALAGLAIENSMLGAAHAAANPLTAHFNIVHGTAVGLMLPHVIRYNTLEPGVRGVYAALATKIGLGDGKSAAERVERLVQHIEEVLNMAGIPRSLADAGGDPAMIPTLAAEATRQWTAGVNARPIDATGFEALYRSAFVARA